MNRLLFKKNLVAQAVENVINEWAFKKMYADVKAGKQ